MFSEILKNIRMQKNISQLELSKQLFVSQQAIGKWEKGTASPNPEMILRIAKYFNVSTDFLLGNMYEKEKPAQDEQTLKIKKYLDEIPPEKLDQVIDYIKFLNSQDKK